MGAGGLLSTSEDLLRWARNFDEMTVGGPDFVDLILRRGTLNNGDSLATSGGLGHREHRGLTMLSNSGQQQGFLARLRRFPEQRFAVAVLCNSLTIDINRLALGVADIYLHDVFDAAATEREARPAPEREARPAPEVVSVSTDELERVTGHYWAFGQPSLWRVYVQDDTLRVSILAGQEAKLVPLGNDRFQMLGRPNVLEEPSL